MDESVIKSIAKEVAKNLSRVPPHMTYWGWEEIAASLGLSKTSVDRLVNLPDFPPCFTFPNGAGGHMNRRWLAKDVQDWAMSYRGKKS